MFILENKTKFQSRYQTFVSETSFNWVNLYYSGVKEIKYFRKMTTDGGPGNNGSILITNMTVMMFTLAGLVS